MRTCTALRTVELHAANSNTRRSKPRDSHATRSTLCYRSRCYTGYRDLERPPEMTAATNSSAHSPAPCHSSPRGSSSRQYRWGISLDHRVGHILGGTPEDEDDLVGPLRRVGGESLDHVIPRLGLDDVEGLRICP